MRALSSGPFLTNAGGEHVVLTQQTEGDGPQRPSAGEGRCVQPGDTSSRDGQWLRGLFPSTLSWGEASAHAAQITQKQEIRQQSYMVNHIHQA